jgi:hypothetical protein
LQQIDLLLPAQCAYSSLANTEIWVFMVETGFASHLRFRFRFRFRLYFISDGNCTFYTPLHLFGLSALTLRRHMWRNSTFEGKTLITIAKDHQAKYTEGNC